jgi:hypothetical protein
VYIIQPFNGTEDLFHAAIMFISEIRIGHSSGDEYSGPDVFLGFHQ